MLKEKNKRQHMVCLATAARHTKAVIERSRSLCIGQQYMSKNTAGYMELCGTLYSGLVDFFNVH